MAIPPHLLISEVSHKATPAIDIASASTTLTRNPRPFEHEAVPWALLGTLIFVAGLLYTYYLTVFRFARYPAWYWAPMISCSHSYLLI